MSRPPTRRRKTRIPQNNHGEIVLGATTGAASGAGFGVGSATGSGLEVGVATGAGDGGGGGTKLLVSRWVRVRFCESLVRSAKTTGSPVSPPVTSIFAVPPLLITSS